MDVQSKRKVRIGDILLEKGLLTPEQLETALTEQKRTRKKLGKTVIDLGFISEVKLLRELSDFLGYPYVDLSRFRLDTSLIHQLPESQARRYRCLLLADEPNGVLVGMADPTDLIPGNTLVQLLNDLQISNVLLPPSALAVMPNDPLPHLSTLVAGAEPCFRNTVQRWGHGRRFFNAYGPTEATVTATVHECSVDDPDDPPIGSARPHATVYVLDDNLQPVTDGQTGETAPLLSTGLDTGVRRGLRLTPVRSLNERGCS